MIVLRKPLITEKSLRLYKDNKVVTFEVDLKADRTLVKKAVESIYTVKAKGVRIANRLGKEKFSRFSKKRSKLADRKIAYITLDSKSKIDIFEQ